MADITMCTQTLCPNAGHCYRVQAKPSEHWQSMCSFGYTVSERGVECENYWPMGTLTTSANTAPNGVVEGPPAASSRAVRSHEELGG